MAQECSLVLLNRRLDAIPSIIFDNAAGVRAVLQHLVALGHRRIGYAAGPVTSWSDAQRAEAFRAFGEHAEGLELVELGNFPPYFSGGVSAGDLAVASGVTAVLAFNDLIALGLIERLRQRGLSVPDDVSVTGFDDVSVATLAAPHLTTVHLPRIRIGRSSVDLLLETVLGGPDELHLAQVVPVELVVRQSSGVATTRRASASPPDSRSGALRA